MFRIGYGAVAILGLGYSQSQFHRMTRYPRRIVCFDSDPPGQRRAKRLCRELDAYPGETMNVCLDFPDPGSASVKEIRMLRALAFK